MVKISLRDYHTTCATGNHRFVHGCGISGPILQGAVASACVIATAVVVILGTVSGAVIGLILSRNLMDDSAWTGGADPVTFSIPWPTMLITVGVATTAALVMSWFGVTHVAGGCTVLRVGRWPTNESHAAWEWPSFCADTEGVTSCTMDQDRCLIGTG